MCSVRSWWITVVFLGFLLITLHCTYAKHKTGLSIKECPISFLKPLGFYIQGTCIISTTAFKNNLDKTLEGMHGSQRVLFSDGQGWLCIIPLPRNPWPLQPCRSSGALPMWMWSLTPCANAVPSLSFTTVPSLSFPSCQWGHVL